jgi:hypothetical protein
MLPIFSTEKNDYYPGLVVSDDRGVYRIDSYCDTRRTCILTNIITGQIITLTEDNIKDMVFPERK